MGLGTGVLLLVAAATLAEGGELELHGVGAARGLAVESRPAWIDGGFGRLTEGQDAASFEGAVRAEAELGLDWSPSPVVLLRLQGAARTEPGAAGGWRAGLVEAFLQYRPELRPGAALRLRAGLMFPPTSRENVDPLWQSPYTLTLSALNSWIGEEVRLTGLDVAALLGSSGRSRFELGGMAFGGNDTAGALLAWRGWAFGPRLAVAGETLPLPPLPTLAPGGPFAAQRGDGTVPVDELDGRVGWHARGRWSRDGLGLLQAAWTDNRGDRGLHRGQYAWDTRFASFGAEAQLGRLRFVAEGLLGDTGMGPAEGPRVDVRIRAGYALLTWPGFGDRLRLTARLDGFRNDDRDGQAEPNGESGWAMTFAFLCSPRPWLRAGVEYLDLRSDRPAAAFSGTPASTNGRRAQAELRLRF
ncbi:MAG TPA: hypothetical protein VMT70_17660 [Vicinamibacteria bacterium]|nr:hypothetical protein [Vicinamibacteria bacterium]